MLFRGEFNTGWSMTGGWGRVLNCYIYILQKKKKADEIVAVI